MSRTLFQRMIDMGSARGATARAEMAKRIARRVCAERNAMCGEPPCFKIAPDRPLDCGSDTETDDITCQVIGEMAVEEIWT